MIALKQVLVPTDFSEPSDAALAYGRELARAFGAKLHVLHVAESLMTTAGIEYFSASLPEVQAGIEEAARKKLQTIITAQDREELQAEVAVRTWTSPAAGILEYAKEEDIDLIVMGTHGRGAMSRFLIGSVAERVVRTAPCPVLTVHRPEHDFLAPDVVALVAAHA